MNYRLGYIISKVSNVFDPPWPSWLNLIKIYYVYDNTWTADKGKATIFDSSEDARRRAKLVDAIVEEFVTPIKGDKFSAKRG